MKFRPAVFFWTIWSAVVAFAAWSAFSRTGIVPTFHQLATTAACDDATDAAVLGKVHDSLGGIFGRPDTSQEFAEYYVKIAGIRNWAMGLPNGCVRESYLKWLDYDEREARSRQAVIKIGAEVPTPPEVKR